jgi:hypothetical protein
VAPALQSAAAPAPPSAGLAGRDEAWLRRELEAMRLEIERNVTEKVFASVLGALGRPGGAPLPGADVDDDDEGRPALVCDADPQAAAFMAGVLREMGFVPQASSDLKTAWRILDKDQHIVVVTDHFSDDPEGATKVLERLSRLPGRKRRKTFVAYVSGDVKTSDGGLAFVVGANLTIGRADLARFKEALRRGIAERDKLYRPFYAAMEAASEGSTT